MFNSSLARLGLTRILQRQVSHLAESSRLYSSKRKDDEGKSPPKRPDKSSWREQIRQRVQQRKVDSAGSDVRKDFLREFGADEEARTPKERAPSSSGGDLTDMLMKSLGEATPEESGETDFGKLKNLLSSLAGDAKAEKPREEPKVDFIPETEKEADDVSSSDDVRKVGHLIPGFINYTIAEANEELNRYRKLTKMTEVFEVGYPEVKKPLLDYSEGRSLGIFNESVMSNAGKQDAFVSIQEKEEAKKLKEVRFATGPSHGYIDMLKDADRMWQFPVDNEVVKVEEEGVGFEEHIFLEDHLEDFPESEPVRRFMELVITGLQQNPHMTAKEKREHIYWFKDYFEKFSEEDLVFS